MSKITLEITEVVNGLTISETPILFKEIFLRLRQLALPQ